MAPDGALCGAKAAHPMECYAVIGDSQLQRDSLGHAAR